MALRHVRAQPLDQQVEHLPVDRVAEPGNHVGDDVGTERDEVLGRLDRVARNG